MDLIKHNPSFQREMLAIMAAVNSEAARSSPGTFGREGRRFCGTDCWNEREGGNGCSARWQFKSWGDQSRKQWWDPPENRSTHSVSPCFRTRWPANQPAEDSPVPVSDDPSRIWTGKDVSCIQLNCFLMLTFTNYLFSFLRWCQLHLKQACFFVLRIMAMSKTTTDHVYVAVVQGTPCELWLTNFESAVTAEIGPLELFGFNVGSFQEKPAGE